VGFRVRKSASEQAKTHAAVQDALKAVQGLYGCRPGVKITPVVVPATPAPTAAPFPSTPQPTPMNQSTCR
jgi:hypothetical protein